MAQVQSGQDSQGIKLFGAMITLQGRQIEEGENGNEEDHVEEIKKPDKIIPCPRCKSMDTKFCYFNNYNVNQPRHFCKGCQRYWTAGGALRNVPVGAGRRKAKPPCRGACGLPEGGLCGASEVQLCGLDDWHVAVAHSDHFWQVFPSKRRRTS